MSTTEEKGGGNPTSSPRDATGFSVLGLLVHVLGLLKQSPAPYSSHRREPFLSHNTVKRASDSATLAYHNVSQHTIFQKATSS